MTDKTPYSGHPRGYVAPFEGMRHRHNRETVEVSFRIRYELLDELNARFLADRSCTTFAEYMRKITLAGLEALPK